MLSRKVDLTEHSDFGGRLEDLIEAIDFTQANIIEDEEMTFYDYKILKAYENIFGQRGHYTEKSKVFLNKEILSATSEIKIHCIRCGKELKAPWKRFHNMCKNCYDTLERTNESSVKFPWGQNKKIMNEKDILQMR